MVNYKIFFTKQGDKDKKLIKQAGLEGKARELIKVIAENPFQDPIPYEKMVGILSKFYSRRISLQHRLVYEVIEEEKAVKVIRMWSHYDNVK